MTGVTEGFLAALDAGEAAQGSHQHEKPLAARDAAEAAQDHALHACVRMSRMQAVSTAHGDAHVENPAVSTASAAPSSPQCMRRCMKILLAGRYT